MSLTVTLQLWWALPAVITFCVVVWTAVHDLRYHDDNFGVVAFFCVMAWLLILWGHFV